MSNQLPKQQRQRPIRLHPKLMTAAEQAALAEQHEAERLGRVAFHHEETRDVCPFAEGSLRELWLKGYDTTSRRGKSRPDMHQAIGAGFYAFMDGLRHDENPYRSRGQARTDWLEGWEKARLSKEKDDQRHR